VNSDDESSTGAAIPESGEVGYRRPPLGGRFQKGRSGNPSGRPRGSANLATILTKTLREKVVINENGQRKTLTKLQAAVKQLVNKAASGELRALQQLVELAREAEAKQGPSGAQNPSLSELDREVMQGILHRFQLNDGEGPSSEEENSGEPNSR
jgi:Family of unknown function (DUF5681)